MKKYEFMRLHYTEVTEVVNEWAAAGWIAAHMTTSGEMVSVLLESDV